MPSMPHPDGQSLPCPAGLSSQPGAPQPPQQGLPQARKIARDTRERILDPGGLALKAQANSLPGLACLLLAGSQPPRQ
ncbi:MAG: hypothetical protein V1806_07020 [Pseudomonadota bacterium]